MPKLTKNQDWFLEVKNNIRLENNESFFKGEIPAPDGTKKAMRYGTGEGKTYNAAYFALYNLFYTDKKIVISTTKNENVEDLLTEIFDILKANTSKTEPLAQFLGDGIKKSVGKQLLKKLGINKMVSYNQIAKDLLESARVIITNHSYFYPNGHSSYYFKNILKLMEVIRADDIFIIDEADEFEKMAETSIQLNDFLKTVKSSTDNILRPAKNCFSSRDKDVYIKNADEYRYELPVENSNIRFTKEGDFDTPTYVLDQTSNNLNLDQLINEFYFEKHTFEDIGRRIGFMIDAYDNKYKLLRVYKGEYLVGNNINHYNIETNDILRLIQNSIGATKVEQVIRLLDPVSEESIIDFDTREEFVKWCQKNMTIQQYDKMLKKLMNEAQLLYKRFLTVKRKSILDTSKCSNVYYITATPYNLTQLDYIVENGKSKKVNTIENIDMFFINRDISVDNLVINLATECLLNYKDDINCLAFAAEKRNVEKLIKSKKYLYKDKKYSGIKVKTSINDDSLVDYKGITAVLGEADNYEYIKDYSYITYLNSPEATGKNYKVSNLCLINTQPEINALGRQLITKEYAKFIDIEDSSFRTILQACGRIERADKEKYKAIIFIGKNESIIEKYIIEKKGNGINYNFMSDKTIALGEKHLKNKIIKVFDHIRVNLTSDFEEIQLSFEDNRKKHNKSEIIQYFNNLIANEIDSKEAKKQTIYKFGVARNLLNQYIKGQ
ncbi:MAG: hypothetical protein EHM20_00190 [Alphaproteobacteria bacterium]|nr:MAG: hypothetical protein EHM20_00190 [Alphaproteobacteria bacterium]